MGEIESEARENENELKDEGRFVPPVPGAGEMCPRAKSVAAGRNRYIATFDLTWRTFCQPDDDDDRGDDVKRR